MMGSCAGDVFACSSHRQTVSRGGPPKNVDCKDSESSYLDLMSVEGVTEPLQMTHSCSCGLST